MEIPIPLVETLGILSDRLVYKVGSSGTRAEVSRATGSTKILLANFNSSRVFHAYPGSPQEPSLVSREAFVVVILFRRKRRIPFIICSILFVHLLIIFQALHAIDKSLIRFALEPHRWIRTRDADFIRECAETPIDA